MDRGIKRKRNILVIENAFSSDNLSVNDLLSSDAEFRCESKPWDALVPDQLQHCSAELIVPVAYPHPESAKKLFQWLRSNATAIPALAVLPGEPDRELLELAYETADDFILWPARPAELHKRALRLIGGPRSGPNEARRRLVHEVGLAQLVGSDEPFLRVVEQIPLIATSGAPVLLAGETGTGKELAARAIHLLSSRSAGPFVPVDCTAIPEHLLENELFGHARGAFTDAHRDQKGLTAMAAGGSLFLDEVDALSLGSQAKLLRLLQEGTYRALGAQRFDEADVRVIAATNQDLQVCVREKSFRSDLYFRLNVLCLRMPSLRERRGDITLLAHHFLNLLSARNGTTPKTLSPAARRKLGSYDWPGNVRELFNVIQRADLLSPAQQIQPSDISLPSPGEPPWNTTASFREARAQTLGAFEREYVAQMLCRHSGNITHAALEAQKDRRAFGRLVKKHHLGGTAC